MRNSNSNSNSMVSSKKRARAEATTQARFEKRMREAQRNAAREARENAIASASRAHLEFILRKIWEDSQTGRELVEKELMVSDSDVERLDSDYEEEDSEESDTPKPKVYTQPRYAICGRCLKDYDVLGENCGERECSYHKGTVLETLP